MEANDASLGSGDATTRAQELRASLGARQDAESMLAEASKIRQEAVASRTPSSRRPSSSPRSSCARAVLADAERPSRRATAPTASWPGPDRGRGARRTGPGATADAIRAKAESDVEEHRRRVRAEVTDQVTRDLTEKYEREAAAAREQSESLVSDLEASVRILGVSLESPLANVSELLGSLEGLRSTSETGHAHVGRVEPSSSDRLRRDPDRGPARARTTSRPRPRTRAARVGAGGRARRGSRRGAGRRVVVRRRQPAPATSVPSAVSQFRAESDEEPVPERPRTATEAFLSSSALEIDQATRELRDLQHPEEARRRRSEESRRAAQRRELEEGLADDGDPEPERPDRSAGCSAAPSSAPDRPPVRDTICAQIASSGKLTAKSG